MYSEIINYTGFSIDIDIVESAGSKAIILSGGPSGIAASGEPLILVLNTRCRCTSSRDLLWTLVFSIKMRYTEYRY